jgi:hypothetical protein
MVRIEGRIILAIECSHCLQITSMKVYNEALYIDRCGACGQTFRAADDLVYQYESYANRIAHHESLHQMFQEVLEAAKLALEHWGQKVGKEALVRVLHKEEIVDAETGNVLRCPP